MPPDPLQMLTAAEVAALMRHSEGWVRRQYREGRLRYLRSGRSVRFRRADVEAFQQSLDPRQPVRLAEVRELRPVA
jgi:excisionase family DNA binding protein